MTVERYPEDRAIRRTQQPTQMRWQRPGPKPDYVPRDKRGRPLKDREGIRKPKAWPKPTNSQMMAAQKMARRMMRSRLQLAAELGPKAMTAVQSWRDFRQFWRETNGDTQRIVKPGEETVNTDHFELLQNCEGWDGYASYNVNDYWAAGCGSLQLVPNTSMDNPSTRWRYGWPDVTYPGFRLWNFNDFPNGSYTRLRFAQSWKRKSGSTNAPPEEWFVSTPGQTVPFPGNSDLTFEWPQEWPRHKRWREAVAEPGTQPDGSPDPDRKGQPGRKDAQRTTVAVPAIPGLRVTLAPDIGVQPVPETAEMTVTPNNPRVEVKAKNPPPSSSKPFQGSRRREAPKATIVSVAPMTWAGINFVTEAADFINALHDSLPKSMQAKKGAWGKPKLHDMAVAIYEGRDHISVATAVQNFINEWIEDRWYAAASYPAKRAMQATGQSTGADRAMNSGGAGPGAAPEIDLDISTGNWSIQTPAGTMSGNAWNTAVDWDPNL